eukprot:316183_1
MTPSKYPTYATISPTQNPTFNGSFITPFELTCEHNIRSGVTSVSNNYDKYFKIILKSTHDITINTCGIGVFDSVILWYTDYNRWISDQYPYSLYDAVAEDLPCTPNYGTIFNTIALPPAEYFVTIAPYNGFETGLFTLTLTCSGGYPTTPPTPLPSHMPTIPTVNPTFGPSLSPSSPTLEPTVNPTSQPTINPTTSSQSPTLETLNPTLTPSKYPTYATTSPTQNPTFNGSFISPYELTCEHNIRSGVTSVSNNYDKYFKIILKSTHDITINTCGIGVFDSVILWYTDYNRWISDQYPYSLYDAVTSDLPCTPNYGTIF